MANNIMNELTKINWTQKLSSRKLWIGTALVVIGVIQCVNGDVENGLRVASIGGGVYLGAETIVDVMRIIFVQSKEAENKEAENQTEEVKQDA